MQGQRSTVQSLTETFEFDHGSTSNNSGMEELFWNNMLNHVDSQSLPDYLHSPSDTNIAYVNSVNHDSGNLNIWNLGGSSSVDPTLNQSSHDESKIEHAWTASLTNHAGPSLRLEERRFEPNILSLESVNINLNTNQVANEPLLFQNSSSDDIPQTQNLNPGFDGNGVLVMDAAICPHPYKLGGSETERIPSASGSTDPCAIASGTVEYFSQDVDGRPGCSLDGRRLSCKRKALEGVSGQSSLGGSSSCFQRAETSVWQSVPARHNAASSLSISSPAEHLSVVNPHEGQFNPRFGVDVRGIAPDSHIGSSIAGNAENSQRNFRMRVNPAHQQDSTTPNLIIAPGNASGRSHLWSPLQSSSRLPPFNHPLESRPAATSASSSQSQSVVPHFPGFPARNLHPYPWNGAPNARASSSSSSPVIAGERPSAFREEANSRSIPRSISEHPMFVPANEMRNFTQDPTNGSLVNGNISVPGSSVSSSRIGSSPVVHPTPGLTWVPYQNPPGQYPQRLSEPAFPPLRSTASTSSQEMVLPSVAAHQGHHLPYLRSAFWMDRQGGDGVLGVPLSLRNLAAAPEGRSRLASEIRNVLEHVRRGENLRFEDRHRDMRLDVDNMSYEELLALEERIGNVSTGLSAETISKCLKQCKYVSIALGAQPEIEPCCICQEEYVEGDGLGTLDCGHDFHAACIKQWLMQKNLCPICKTTALIT
ncbi:putative E3 ubiquitin-protein ligase HIP1 [Tasmannia lanceolata]|uniref:putative E3 ubiquitin-protein ligase HIP1 n=1 Tax=Tasmannia lanceolata TaxID=3420 RepID=UPI00406306BE